jgi:hypothetical protein
MTVTGTQQRVYGGTLISLSRRLCPYFQLDTPLYCTPYNLANIVSISISTSGSISTDGDTYTGVGNLTITYTYPSQSHTVRNYTGYATGFLKISNLSTNDIDISCECGSYHIYGSSDDPSTYYIIPFKVIFERETKSVDITLSKNNEDSPDPSIQIIENTTTTYAFNGTVSGLPSTHGTGEIELISSANQTSGYPSESLPCIRYIYSRPEQTTKYWVGTNPIGVIIEPISVYAPISTKFTFSAQAEYKITKCNYLALGIGFAATYDNTSPNTIVAQEDTWMETLITVDNEYWIKLRFNLMVTSYSGIFFYPYAVKLTTSANWPLAGIFSFKNLKHTISFKMTCNMPIPIQTDPGYVEYYYEKGCTSNPNEYGFMPRFIGSGPPVVLQFGPQVCTYIQTIRPCIISAYVIGPDVIKRGESIDLYILVSGVTDKICVRVYTNSGQFYTGKCASGDNVDNSLRYAYAFISIPINDVGIYWMTVYASNAHYETRPYYVSDGVVQCDSLLDTGILTRPEKDVTTLLYESLDIVIFETNFTPSVDYNISITGVGFIMIPYILYMTLRDIPYPNEHIPLNMDSISPVIQRITDYTIILIGVSESEAQAILSHGYLDSRYNFSYVTGAEGENYELVTYHDGEEIIPMPLSSGCITLFNTETTPGVLNPSGRGEYAEQKLSVPYYPGVTLDDHLNIFWHELLHAQGLDPHEIYSGDESAPFNTSSPNYLHMYRYALAVDEDDIAHAIQSNVPIPYPESSIFALLYYQLLEEKNFDDRQCKFYIDTAELCVYNEEGSLIDTISMSLGDFNSVDRQTGYYGLQYALKLYPSYTLSEPITPNATFKIKVEGHADSDFVETVTFEFRTSSHPGWLAIVGFNLVSSRSATNASKVVRFTDPNLKRPVLGISHTLNLPIAKYVTCEE